MAADAPPQEALLPPSAEEIEFMTQRVCQTSATLDQKAVARAKAQAAETKAKKEHAKACRALRAARGTADPDDDDGADDDDD